MRPIAFPAPSAILLVGLVLAGCQAGSGENNGGGAGAANQPSEPPAITAEVTPEARAVLDQMRDAYKNLKTLELAGQIESDFNVAGEQQKFTQRVTGKYEAPDKFRHEIGDELIVGSTGEKVYMYNPRANAYFQADVPEGETAAQAARGPVLDLLQSQDPGLLLAVAEDPLRYLLRDAKSVKKLPDAREGDATYQTVEIKMAGDDRVVLLIDPQTHFLREMRLDLKGGPKEQKAPNAKQTELTIRYKSIVPGAKFPVDYFSWKPPQGARNVAEQGPPAEPAAKQLVGQPAPDFTLKTLDGQEVSLAELKGRAVVLDFWATWCPPCVESLPHLDQLAADYDESQLAVYAVNVREPAEMVRTFIEKHEIKMPVLLDPDGEAKKKYRAASIPQTVVIGPDGVVQRVFVGIGPNTYEDIRETVAALTR